jgi:hypothetical protein
MRFPLQLKKNWGSLGRGEQAPISLQGVVSKNKNKKIQQTNVNVLYTLSSKACEKMEK